MKNLASTIRKRFDLLRRSISYLIFFDIKVLSDPGHNLCHLQVLLQVKSNLKSNRAAYDPDWEMVFKRCKQMSGSNFEDREAA